MRFVPHRILRWLDTPSRRGTGVRRRGACARAAPRFDMRPTPQAVCGRDVPAPSIRPPPHPANLGRRDLSAFGGKKVDVGRAQHPEPVVVVPVVRVVVVAVVRARVVLIVDPGAAAQHARLGLGTPHRFPGPRKLPYLRLPVEPGGQQARGAPVYKNRARPRCARFSGQSISVQ